MGFFTWFRDSQTPRSVRKIRQEHAERLAKSSSRSSRDRLVDFNRPSYYAFFYREDQVAGDRVLPARKSGWKHPKQYWGPFDTLGAAERVVHKQLKEYGESLRNQYKIRRLMPAGFVKIWGSLPGEASPGY